jgi:hypothetical protein
VTRIAGVVLLALMIIHVTTQPEGPWVLLSTCDVAALVTAVGLVGGWHRAVAVACLFEIMVGLPAFVVGIFTTYELNPTGVVVHIVPPVLGVIVIAREGLPRHAALMAWTGYTLTFLVAFAIAPPVFNVNFANDVWPPLAGVFTVRGSFQAALIAVAIVVLSLGELIARRILGVRTMISSGPAPAPRRLRDTD